MKLFDNRKNVLILGDGQLGCELKDYLSQKEDINTILSVDRMDFEIKRNLDYQFLDKCLSDIINKTKIDCIVNCIAYTNTKKAERKEYGYIDAMVVNSIFPKLLAQYCRNKKIKLIHISTDYVSSEFGDELPINIYGMSKLMGDKNIQIELKERNYLIIRTSWLYSLKHNSNFVSRLIDNCIEAYENNKKSFEYQEVSVTTNEISIPTNVKTLCDCIFRGILDKNIVGIVNCTDSPTPDVGENCEYNGISRYDFAVGILSYCRYLTYGTENERLFRNIKLIPTNIDDFSNSDGKMSYPKNSTLQPNIDFVGEFWLDNLEKEIKENLDSFIESE